MKTKKQSGMGPAGKCICPKCGAKKKHTPGKPCTEERCDSCGSAMVRENSYHHNLLKEKRNL